MHRPTHAQVYNTRMQILNAHTRRAPTHTYSDIDTHKHRNTHTQTHTHKQTNKHRNPCEWYIFTHISTRRRKRTEETTA